MASVKHGQGLGRRLLPVILGVLFSSIVITVFYLQDLQSRKALRKAELKVHAQSVAQWLDQSFSDVNKVLRGLQHEPMDCSAETLYQLRSGLFLLPQIVELGLVDQFGQLHCTSWQMLIPPRKVNVPPTHRGLRVYWPLTSEYLGKPALVLARTRSDGGEINALMLQAWLKNQLRRQVSPLGFIALVDADTGTPVVKDGVYSLPIGLQPPLFPLYEPRESTEPFDDRREHYFYIQPLLTQPNLAVVISEETQWLYRDIYRPSYQQVVVALFLMGISVFLACRFRRWATDPVRELRAAVDRNQFYNLYQPLVDASDGHLCGVEVLMRWLHPEEGVVMPGNFIPLAERSGLLPRMTLKQLEQVQTDLTPVLEIYPDLKVSVNINADFLMNQACVTELISYRYALPGLAIEITEGQMLRLEEAQIQQSLNLISGAGIQIAIDDFGTGYCGLAYLQSIPVDILKADRCFVTALGTDSVNAQVLETILELAARLELIVIAEGVEHLAQSIRLRELGVDILQGFYHGYPASADALKRQIEAGQFLAVQQNLASAVYI